MNPTQPETTIKDRLGAMVGAILQSSRFNAAFIPVIRNLIKKFMMDSTEEDLKRGIEELRDKYIPWVLTGVMPEEQTNQLTNGQGNQSTEQAIEAHDENTLKEQ